MKGLKAIRGNIVSAGSIGGLSVVERGCIVTEDGAIRGVFGSLPEKYAAAVVEDFGDAIIVPGFSDMHLHAPQYPNLGLGMDLQLLDWLNTYTFPTEAEFADTDYARKVYSHLARALIERGTTRVAIFSSTHREATLVLMEELERAGVTGLVGKVNMDRNTTPELTETPEGSERETRRWIDECAKFKHVRPVITPRFTPSCTDGLMRRLGGIANEYGLPVQSHISENTDEIAWVKQLCPECSAYWETYDRFGLWKEGTLMAHCVYSDAAERAAMKRAGVYAVHCPDSNTNIASGIAPVRLMLDEGVKVLLGSDISGGAKLSMLDTAAGAIRASKLRWLFSGKEEAFLTVREAFYLITTAGQEYFGQKPGFGEGDMLHAVVLDDGRLIKKSGMSTEARLERLMYLSTPEDVAAVYSEGVRRK